MSDYVYPSNSFRYKLIYSFFCVFLQIDDYLLIKDTIYGKTLSMADCGNVRLIQQLNRLYSLIFYSQYSDKSCFVTEDYFYIFPNKKINQTIINKIEICSNWAILMSEIIINDGYQIEEKALYYFLLIKRISERYGVCICLPNEVAEELRSNTPFSEEMGLSYFIQAKILNIVNIEKNKIINTERIRSVYQTELCDFRDCIERIEVFGSVVRCEYNEDSDIDLIVYVNNAPPTTVEVIKKQIKAVNIIRFNRKSDIHIVKNGERKITFKGDSYEVF